uniref:DUF1279 domain-containing protein n=1 Tax=Anas platyrhynchos TaxID=8839 RepID=A0A8B9T3U0_ANAPL
MPTWRLATETLRSWQEEKRVQTAAAQATQAGEIKSGDCVPPEKANLIDLGPRSPPPAAAAAPRPPRAGPPSARRPLCWRCGPPPAAATDLSSENKKLNKSQQLKKVFKEYGTVGVSFHVGISLVSLGIFYLAVSSGVDMTAVLFKLGFSESSLQSKRAAGTGTFALAYSIHKFITIVSVTFTVRYSRKIGFFKPPSPNP